MNSINFYKISELSRISSIPITTIRYYLKEGLIPPSLKTGKTSAVYSDDHLNRLLLIKKLQAKEHRTLSSIKEELSRMPIALVPKEDVVIASSEKRNAIVSAAIDLFIKKGLGETSIDDIVNQARIGKGTFYKYFKDKDELFIQCADAIFYEMYRNVWHEIKNERDMVRRLFKRSEAFFNSYPRWVDMMNLVRYASVGNNPFFKEKLNTVLKHIIEPIAHDLAILQREGKISKDIDCLGVAYMIMGMTEYAAWLMSNGDYNAGEISGILRELFNKGMQ